MTIEELDQLVQREWADTARLEEELEMSFSRMTVTIQSVPEGHTLASLSRRHPGVTFKIVPAPRRNRPEELRATARRSPRVTFLSHADMWKA